MYLLNVIPTKNQYDETIKDILNNSKYAYIKNIFSRFFSYLQNQISNFTRKLLKSINLGDTGNKSISLSDKISYVIMIAVIILFIILVAFIIVKINKMFNKKNRIKEILGEKINEDTTPESLREKALSFSSINKYKEAVRYDFIALLLLMHEKNVIFLDESSTNFEIGIFLRNNSFNDADIYDYLSDMFNYVWYGDKPCANEKYEDWNSNLNKLWNEVQNNEKKFK